MCAMKTMRMARGPQALRGRMVVSARQMKMPQLTRVSVPPTTPTFNFLPTLCASDLTVPTWQCLSPFFGHDAFVCCASPRSKHSSLRQNNFHACRMVWVHLLLMDAWATTRPYSCTQCHADLFGHALF